jgi:hypothetical protein
MPISDICMGLPGIAIRACWAMSVCLMPRILTSQRAGGGLLQIGQKQQEYQHTDGA